MKQTLLSQTNLSVRSINCLNTADIRTVEDLKKFASENPLNDLIKFRNFGRRSFNEVKQLLRDEEIKLTLEDKKCCNKCLGSIEECAIFETISVDNNSFYCSEFKTK